MILTPFESTCNCMPRMLDPYYGLGLKAGAPTPWGQDGGPAGPGSAESSLAVAANKLLQVTSSFEITV